MKKLIYKLVYLYNENDIFVIKVYMLNPTETDLSNSLIKLLSAETHPISALSLAKKLNLQTAKTVNPSLYKLEKLDKVIKLDTRPPTWIIKKQTISQPTYNNPPLMTPGLTNFNHVSPIEVKISKELKNSDLLITKNSKMATLGKFENSENNLFIKNNIPDELRNIIFEYLRTENQPVDAKYIINNIFCDNITISHVNSILYNLMSDDLIRRLPTTPPLWYIPKLYNKDVLILEITESLELTNLENLLFIRHLLKNSML
jgi:hypothetical protein